MTRVDQLLAVASSEIGKPYVYGDEGPNTFDCSGLSQYAYGYVGIKLPRTARQQQAATTRVTNPLPGDLVFYGSPAYHVGIYLGGGKMINAPDVNQRVRIDNVGKPTNYGRVSGLGAAAAVPISLVTGAGSVVGDTAAAMLGGAQHIALEAAFLGLGLALVGVGLWRASKGARGRLKSTVSDGTTGVL